MGVHKEKRRVLAEDYANIRVTRSTAPSTSLAPRGVIAIATTSTGAAVVYTLGSLPKRGRRFEVAISTIASSSVGVVHINAASGSFLGSSSQDMLTLPVSGNGASFIGLSSERWLCVGTNGGTFSTST